MPQSLTSATVHGLKWTYASSFVNVVLQIGVTAVLARLLTPSAFGLVAMAGVFLRFGQYFAQMGAGQAVVQKAELSVRDLRTAFTSSLLIGAAFCGLFVALAPLAGALFPDTPGVVPVARVMSLTFLVGGLAATTQGLLRRRFAFRAVALTDIGSFVVGYALVGLVLATLGFGAWSLVAASLTQGALAAATCTLLCRRDIGFCLDARSFRLIYSFGGRVSVIGFLEFIGGSLDTLWAGHFLGTRVTGLYSRATNLANLPLYYFAASLSSVLLPAYSRIQSQWERLRATYLSTISVVAAIAMPVAWGVAGASHEIVAVLLGDQWVQTAAPLAVLSLAVPLTTATLFGAILCEATATLRVKILVSAGRVAWLCALLVVLSPLGIFGVAVAFAISETVMYVAYTLVMRKLLHLRGKDLLRSYAQGVGTGILTGLALYGLHLARPLADLGAPATLALQVLTGAGLLALSLTRLRGGFVWREVRTRLRPQSAATTQMVD